MKIGEIFLSLLSYSPKYDQHLDEKLDQILDLFKYETELKEISFGNVIVFTDSRPNSLLAISYYDSRQEQDGSYLDS